MKDAATLFAWTGLSTVAGWLLTSGHLFGGCLILAGQGIIGTIGLIANAIDSDN